MFSLVSFTGATTFSKLGVQCLGLGYCTEQNTDGIGLPSFVHCSLQLRKKLGWYVQILGVRTPDTPSGCALGVIWTLGLGVLDVGVQV